MSKQIKKIPDSGTAGIVIDDYKVERLKEKLTWSVFAFTVHPFKPGLTVVKVIYETPEGLHLINQIVRQVQDHFKPGK